MAIAAADDEIGAAVGGVGQQAGADIIGVGQFTQCRIDPVAGKMPCQVKARQFLARQVF